MASLSRPTIRDVAQAAGVSITTVSHSLHDKGYVDPETRRRVKAAARKLGYRPNLHAQRLRQGGAHMIALMSSMPFGVSAGPSHLGFLMEVAAVAAEASLSRGLALVLVPPRKDEALPLDSLAIDGALVIEPVANDPTVAALRRSGLPVVTIGRQPDARPMIPHVDIHSALTARLLLEHLHAQGARQIGLIIGSARRNSYVESEAAYRTFARARRMRCLVTHADEAGGEDAGRDAALHLLAKHPQIDGLCAPVDAFAVGAVQAAAQLARRVPGDLLVATRYDGLRARNCNPPLTAVRLHLDRVAALAVDLLFEQLQGGAARKRVAGPEPELIVRSSSSAGPGRLVDVCAGRLEEPCR